MTRLTTVLAALLAITSIMISAPATAQSASKQKEVDEGRAMVAAGRKEMVRMELGLSKDEAEAFWPVYDQYTAETKAVQDRYAGLVVRYVNRYDAGDLSDDYADELLTDYFAIRQELLDVRRAYIPKFKAVLPSLKVARFYQLENKINAEIDAQLADALPLISE